MVANIKQSTGMNPMGKLVSGWLAYKPQIEDYITRAFKLGAAPSYGVPGDL